MATSLIPLSSQHHSLVSWFVLNGVSYEVSDFSNTWQRAPVANTLEAPKPVNTPVLKVIPKATETKLVFPRFDTMHAFCDHVRTIKDFALCKTASQAVIGIGQHQSPGLMVIGEMPETSEDQSGIAFDGVAGQFVRQALIAAGFDPAQVYMTYLSKWRTPGQRNLYATEAQTLLPLLDEEIRLIQPCAILLLGDVVARTFLGESTQNRIVLGKKLSVEKQSLGKSLPILTSQKGEFLVKNSSTKKNFWFSLIDFAVTIREERSTVLPSLPETNTEQNSDVP